MNRNPFKKDEINPIMSFLLLRYGELFLKGGNQYQFIRALCSNIKAITNHGAQINQGRLNMNYFDEHSLLQNIFGLVSYSIVQKVNSDLSTITQKATEMLESKKGTFRIDTKRSDKRFPTTSLDVNRHIGEHIETHTKLSFSLKDPQNILRIEINNTGTYLFFDENTYACHGGLPTGIEGRVGLLVEDELSALAGILIMRRGCGVYPIILESNQNPFIEEKTIAKLQKYSPSPVLLTKCTTYEEIDQFVKEKRLACLITSSTQLNPRTYSLSCVILHPLICESQEKITELKKKYLS